MRTTFALLVTLIACTVGERSPPSDQPPADTDTKGTMIRRLSRMQLQNSVREFFSSLTTSRRDALLAAVQTRLDLIPVDSAEGFALNDTSLGADHVEAVQGLAMALMQAINDPNASYANDLMAICNGKTLADDGCLMTFVQRYGRRAFRRPLTQAEVDDFKTFYREAAGVGADQALGLLVARMIAHPNFYYRFDNEGDQVSGIEGQHAVYRLSKWELLSKLTFLFWMAPPTDALYDRVEATDITADDSLKTITDDILKDSRAEAGIVEFFREWLALDRIVTPVSTGNGPAGYALVVAAGLVQLPNTHRQDMIQDVLDLAKYYSATTEGTLSDIFTSQYSFARTPELAKIYGVAPWDGSAAHMIQFPPGQRSGLLSRAAMVISNFEYTRPIMKGVAIQRHILCAPAPPPPPDLDLVPVLYVTDKTTRQSTEIATMSPQCQGCHGSLNALGFATEHYDSLGRFRAQEPMFGPNITDAQGRGTAVVAAQLDIDSKVTLTLPSQKTQTVANAIELGQFIAQSGDAHACMAKGYFSFAVKPLIDSDDTAAIDNLQSVLQNASIRTMQRETALSQAFRQRMVR